jgi:lipopolysaccharide/colanic/teichoic acid biosynthesis glycosyltransferase
VEDLVSEPSIDPPSADRLAARTRDRAMVRPRGRTGLTKAQAIQKRLLDIVLSVIGLVCLSWLILLAFVAATIDTRANGFFRQERIGYRGRRFKVIKIRSMRDDPRHRTSVTTADDPRITSLGRFLRRTKIDELPQLFNVLLGEMSFVGPRPEVPGFADLLTGEDALILTIRPGITGPATIHFRNEEELLRATDDPEAYNATVLFPTKVRMNLEYIRDYSLRGDLEMIWKTIL